MGGEEGGVPGGLLLTHRARTSWDSRALGKVMALLLLVLLVLSRVWEEKGVDPVEMNDTTSTRTLPGSWGHVQSKGRLSGGTGVRSCRWGGPSSMEKAAGQGRNRGSVLVVLVELDAALTGRKGGEPW